MNCASAISFNSIFFICTCSPKDTYNHCQKDLEHQAICGMLLYFSILFPDTPISAPSPPEAMLIIQKNTKKSQKKRTSYPNPLRRFVVDKELKQVWKEPPILALKRHKHIGDLIAHTWGHMLPPPPKSSESVLNSADSAFFVLTRQTLSWHKLKNQWYI